MNRLPGLLLQIPVGTVLQMSLLDVKFYARHSVATEGAKRLSVGRAVERRTLM